MITIWLSDERGRRILTNISNEYRKLQTGSYWYIDERTFNTFVSALGYPSCKVISREHRTCPYVSDRGLIMTEEDATAFILRFGY
jgi:hypothetical protein